MSRKLLKMAYLENVNDKKREKHGEYNAHHLAVLIPELMDNQENCIMLKGGESEDLIENPAYQKWANQKFEIDQLSKISDIKIICEKVKSLKKEIKALSESRDFEEIVSKMQ